MKFDFETEQASSKWLTKILKTNGFLKSGLVERVDQRIANVDAGASATIYTLSVSYTSGATGVCPRQFLMKVAKSGSATSLDETAERYAAWLLLPQRDRYVTLHKEPLFYEYIRNSGAELPLMLCYGSEIDVDNHYTCVLLRDYSETHDQPPWPVPPEEKHCLDTIDSLASIHAHWWNSAEFGNDFLPLIKAEEINEVVSVYQKCYLQFSTILGDRLSKERRSIYEAALKALPDLLKSRLLGSNKLTLCHGDAHHWNMLLPRSGHEVLVFDWQTWHVDTGAHDLAYLMGVLWYRDHRNRQEKPLLDRYRHKLNVMGIDYGPEELVFDYKLSVVRHLFTPVIFSSFVVPAVWWPNMERIFCTFDDWNCVDILSP